MFFMKSRRNFAALWMFFGNFRFPDSQNRFPQMQRRRHLLLRDRLFLNSVEVLAIRAVFPKTGVCVGPFGFLALVWFYFAYFRCQVFVCFESIFCAKYSRSSDCVFARCGFAIFDMAPEPIFRPSVAYPSFFVISVTI